MFCCKVSFEKHPNVHGFAKHVMKWYFTSSVISWIKLCRHCAFSLPAVALTLGRANWPLLKVILDFLVWNLTQKSCSGNLRVAGKRHAMEGEANTGQLDPRAGCYPRPWSRLPRPCSHLQRLHQGPGRGWHIFKQFFNFFFSKYLSKFSWSNNQVRIGVLKHLADFLSLLSPEARAEYLPRQGNHLVTI